MSTNSFAVLVGIMGIFGTILGTVIGFILENKRNLKREKSEHRKFMISLRAEIDSLSLRLLSQALNVIALHLGFVFIERKTKNEIFSMVRGYEHNLRQTETNRIEYNTGLQNYLQTSDHHYKNLCEFCYYLSERESHEVMTIATAMRNFEVSRYNYLKEMSDIEFEIFDFDKQIRIIKTEFNQEFNEIVRSLSTVLDRIILQLN